MGDMITARREHGAIYTEGHFLIVGGSGTRMTDKCELNEDHVVCEEQTPELVDYAYYAELAAVENDFCSSV